MVENTVKGNEKDHSTVMNIVYGDVFRAIYDIIGRNDFFGVTGHRCFGFLANQLELTNESHVLDLCSGIGGPARFLANKYGCRITRIDISKPNHEASVERTREARLDHLIDFIHGDILEEAYPAEEFSHVIGCDSWCYIQEKTQVYSKALHALRPGGVIAFVDSAHEIPSRYRFEKIIGRCHFESVPGYVLKLNSVGFHLVKYNDITELAREDMLDALHRLIKKRESVIDAVGAEPYFSCLESFTEYLLFSLRSGGSHVAMTARKK
jgi:SAM-dependent methyltransferase